MKIYYRIQISHILPAFLFFCFSCSSSKSVQLQIPPQFEAQAIYLPVKGAKGVGFNKKISFGTYYAENIKRGWGYSAGVYDRSDFFSLEQIVLQMFNIQKNDFTTREKNKFYYTLSDGKSMVNIFADEQTITNSTEIKTAVVGKINTANRQRYSFSTAIISGSMSKKDNWLMQLSYDHQMEGGGIASFLKKGLPREEGFLTNQKDTIVVRPVSLRKAEGKNGQLSNLPFDIIGGYEFRLGDGVIGIVDSSKDAIWLYKDMSDQYKMLVASAASALLLRREK